MTARQETAKENLRLLAQNPYPGRGIVIGVDKTGENMVQIYWIMGRSESSRGRVFTADGGMVFTEPLKPLPPGEGNLIIYNAMNEVLFGRHFIVTNGVHTDAIFEAYENTEVPISVSFQAGLKKFFYEPDGPNYTPRIAGVCSPGFNVIAQLAVIRRQWESDKCYRVLYQYEDITPGFGYCVHTYVGDGNPLPSWVGDPKLMPIGDIAKIAETYWNSLNEANRVSLAAKVIPLDPAEDSHVHSSVQIINKYSKAVAG
jgi:IMP cyclohydrolase